MYSAIYTAYIAFQVFLLTQAIEFLSADKPFVLKCTLSVVLFGSIYYSINCGLFIYSSLKLKGFFRSTLKDLKQNHSLIKLAAAYYFDWFSLKNESDVITSIVSNIQKYFFRSLIASVIALSLTLTSFGTLTKSPSHEKKEFLILNESGELQEGELLRFLNTKKNKPISIFVITNRDNKNRSAVISFIKLYSKSEIKIQPIEFNNVVLKEQQVMLKVEE